MTVIKTEFSITARPDLKDDTRDIHYVPAPCQVACPIGTDAPSYIAYVLKQVAAPPLVQRPIHMGFDNDGVLYVTDSSGNTDKAPAATQRPKAPRVEIGRPRRGWRI